MIFLEKAKRLLTNMKVQLENPQTDILLDLMESQVRLTFARDGGVQMEVPDSTPDNIHEERKPQCLKKSVPSVIR